MTDDTTMAAPVEETAAPGAAPAEGGEATA